MLTNHSILTYPINYERFPLTKGVVFTEYIVNEGEYLFIPKYWSHWVFTDPFTLSFHYWSMSESRTTPIQNGCGDDCTDLLYDHMMEEIPFHGHGKPTITMNDLLKNHYQEKTRVIHNHFTYTNTQEYIDFSPVIKENETKKDKYYKIQPMYELVQTSTPFYSIHNFFPPSLYHFQTISNVIDSTVILYYKSTYWFTMIHSASSGLHYDDHHAIIYVAQGRKRILVAEPKYKPYLYFTPLQSIF